MPDTPTPAPALTDEEIDADLATIERIYGNPLGYPHFRSIIAAVIACERERISRELLAAAERMATSASHHIAFRQGIRWAAVATEVDDYA